eukprot:gene1200-10714_t
MVLGKKKSKTELSDPSKNEKKKIMEDKKRLSELDISEKMNLVQKKIQNATGSEVPEKTLVDFSKNLSTPEGIQEAYLNKNFKNALEYFQTIPKQKEKQNYLVSGVESEVLNSISEGQQIEEDEIYSKEDEEILMKTNEKLKIKLVITEIAKNEKERTIRKLLSPVASTLNIGPKCGMFHSALSIGPWYLEWTNRELCIPKKCFSQAAIVALDIDSHLEIVDSDKVIEKLSEVVARWNVNHSYDKSKNNCQVFVDDLLLALDIDPHIKFKGQLGEFVKKLRTKGECNIEYDIPDDIREKCSFKEKKKTFSSHRELDQFVNEILEDFPDFFVSRKSDAALLKSFDRAFWLRYFRDKNNAKYVPDKDYDQPDELQIQCPWDDPVKTRSFGNNDLVE